MLEVTLELTDSRLLAAYRELLTHPAEFLLTSLGQTFHRNQDSILQSLRREPGDVKTPIQWTSEKQRKAYFASNGFGNGIPYRRTHQLSQAWKVSLIYNAGLFAEIAIRNDNPAVVFVEGDRQQAFHAATGWLNATDTLVVALETLENEVTSDLIRGWYAVEG